MNCKKCFKEIESNRTDFCSAECATAFYNKRRLERVCSGCGKIEYISNYNQLKRQCRSCSKIGNTSSKNMSAEARKKISDSKTGKDPWNKGKVGIYSEETKFKMGQKNKGKVLNSEHTEAISQGLCNYYKNHEGPNLGKIQPEEVKQKISESLQKLKAVRTHNTFEDAKAYCESLGLIFIGPEKLEEYISKSMPIKLKCNNLKKDGSRCDNEYITTLNHLEFKVNRSCKSCSSSSSKPEIDIYNYIINDLNIDKIDVLQNKRPAFMQGKELDIWIPKYNFAIEFHGLVHHSERSVYYTKDLTEIRKIHEFKYLRCKENNIKLMQIFEDEWRQSSNLLKSMIKHRLGLSNYKIMGRKCVLKKISSKEKFRFFNENHIAKSTPAQIAWGLFYEENLVCALSLRETWNKAYGEKVIEIARFATKIDTIVIGGFQKLLAFAKQWSIENQYKTILTYSDCRFGSGEVYKNAGFRHLGKTKPNYYYEKDGIREARFKHRKAFHLVGDTEKAQQNNLGWFAIYDAGNEIFLMDLNN